jgi:hypothetical protein
MTIAQNGDDNHHGGDKCWGGRRLKRGPALYIVPDPREASPDGEGRPYIPELPPGCSVLDAALSYAEAGLYVGPIRSGVTSKRKHPGSVLYDDWPSKTTRNADTIRHWFTDTDHGVFIHCGRSGLIVFDVDDIHTVPEELARAIEQEQPPHQPTRTNQPGRGHYVFQIPPGRKFGNGMGKLKPPKGQSKWGEVRGTNGIIVAFPSVHENPEGRYGPWDPPGAIPVLPDYLADLLPDRTQDKPRGARTSRSDQDGPDAATDAEVKAFLDTHTGNERPDCLGTVVKRFGEDIATGSRHEAAVSATCWSLREAAGGLYPASRAHQRLRDAFIQAMAKPTRGSDRELSQEEAKSEFDGILAWAVGQVEAADLEEVRRSALERMRLPAARRRRLRRPSSEEKTAQTSEEEATEQEEDNGPGAVGGREEEALQHDGRVRDDEQVEDPSWVEVDLSEVIHGLADGTRQRPRPTIGVRVDGQALFYQGRVNGIHGESGDGKSFAALQVCVQEIVQDHHVAYIDFEDDSEGTGARLLDLGADPDVVLRCFHYFNPEGPYGPAAQKRLLKLVRETGATLVVIDSTGESMGIEGVQPNADEEVVEWSRLLPRPIASLGPAVMCLDHIPKAKGKTREERLYAIGSQRKKATITGASYLIETIKGREMGRGFLGAADLVCAKDRGGGYRTGDVVATFVLDATAEPYRVEFEVPEPTIRRNEPGFRPTKKMEQVSCYVENNDLLSQRSIVKGVGGDSATTRLALELLITEGSIGIVKVGQAHRHRSLKSYREAADPKAVRVSEDHAPFPAGYVGDDEDEDPDQEESQPRLRRV